MHKGFRIWEGVVEDRNDPLNLGRCRVRVFGLHTSNKTDIPTESLPWAYPAQSLHSAAMNGIGDTPLGPVEGTTVLVYFRDGEEYQQPVMTHTLGGIPEQPEDQNGFQDPNGKYPKEDFLNEPDTNRLARGVTEGTSIQSQNDARDTEVPTATGGTWSEPESSYAAQYPFNKVFESEAGHVIEIDSTEGAERYRIWNPDGSYIEQRADGTTVRKSTNDEYVIVGNDQNVHVIGQYNITVNGNANVYVMGDANTKIDGNENKQIEGTVNIQSGNVTWIAPDIKFIKG